jgi:hypothetical protein
VNSRDCLDHISQSRKDINLCGSAAALVVAAKKN